MRYSLIRLVWCLQACHDFSNVGNALPASKELRVLPSARGTCHKKSMLHALLYEAMCNVLQSKAAPTSSGPLHQHFGGGGAASIPPSPTTQCTVPSPASPPATETTINRNMPYSSTELITLATCQALQLRTQRSSGAWIFSRRASRARHRLQDRQHHTYVNTSSDPSVSSTGTTAAQTGHG
jgi:hypothetical protein